MRLSAALAALLCLSATLVGCSSVGGGGPRYEVVAPPEARGPVPMDVGATLRRDDIEYEVYQSRDKVVLRFTNRTNGPLTLTSDSQLIDARGHTFTVDQQIVGPDQAGRVVVPPSWATTTDEAKRPIASEVRSGGIDEPGLLRQRDDNVARPDPARPTLFAWGQGQLARFRLIFDAGERQIVHEWSIRRE